MQAGVNRLDIRRQAGGQPCDMFTFMRCYHHQPGSV
jgi:hypothetical protein